ncbi:DUF2125 domain-containing protein [Paracoccus shanxieyensis]|uniref:DUF2125 domain-containing protein n=1 Tax=Paracoccus shanxieyensis TaxID=2675752 RepID=A0A6L6J520_9RHOB|nr:DUF2125 domain-containing protein [Paracoccus shanxieyensis]MTH65804.1 DUF2125 domain-containing protein [Paracoccus shanxieyensis]MTH89154.1 DUF2125 domain-containing protein [Paracoccus shanxieyensis]
MSLRLTSSALALAAFTSPAFADVTPEQVWQSWIDYYESVGYTVAEAGRDMAGSTLTLRDVTIEGGAEGNKVVSRIPQVTLTQENGGKVRTVFADQMDMDVSGTEEGSAFSLPVAISMPGNAIVTSGAPEDMTHEFDYPTIDVTLSTITSDGAERPLPITVKLADTTGTFHSVAGTPAKYDYTMATQKLTFQGDVTEEAGDQMKFAGSLDALRSEGTMTAGGKFTDLEGQMSQALKDGLAISGKLATGPGAGTFEFASTDAEGQPSSGSGKYDGKGMDLSFNLSSDGMGYQGATDAVSFEMTSPQFPAPISYGVESGSFDMQLPVTQSDQPQPFKFGYALSGVTLGDQIWAMFDPQAQLPRDPASLEIDLTGLMKVTQDIFAMPAADATPETATDDDASDDAAPADDTDAATADGMTPDTPADDAEAQADADLAQDETMAGDDTAEETPSPFEPVELTINQIALNAVGAKVNASGSLKAPEGGDLSAPVGQIKAEYEGVNGLLDKLGAMGLIPEDQMMGVRMMLAMFAKPVDGNPEKLATDLEFRDGGAIFANGQQIK